MKTISLVSLALIVTVFGVSISNYSYAGKKKMPKIERKFQDKASRMSKRGALAVVGIGVADAGRHDLGKRKAIAHAQQLMAESKRSLVEATTHSFMEEVGIGKRAEHNDVFNNIVDLTASNLISGAFVEDFEYYITKYNRKDKTATYLVLYVISPKTFYKSFENGLNQKGSQENLYQRYIDSEMKKEHEKKIKAFEEKFGVH